MKSVELLRYTVWQWKGVSLVSSPSKELVRKRGAREWVIKVLRAVRLNRIAARIYFRFFHGFESAEKDLPEVVEKCLEHARDNGVIEKGDYYEFGVFKGYTFWRAQVAAEKLGIRDLRFFGFDSFEGLPEVTGIDDIDDAPFYSGQFSWSLARVKKELDSRNTNWNNVHLIKGFFDKTLNDETRIEFGMNKASVVLMDCDLYESAATGLQFLAEMFVDGAILIMDDWYAFGGDETRGEPRALAEFCEKHSEWTAEPWFSYGLYGRVFKMHSSLGA